MENVYVCDYNKCNGCMACIDKCPQKCIEIIDNYNSFNALKNMEICINCNQCLQVCPNITPVQKKTPFEWKQGWAECEIRKNASSGGAASAIIDHFIKTGGFVASCLFSEGKFIFAITNDLVYAKQFAGSKYIKSNPVGIFKKIQERLRTNKVLFIGLPCQVAALRNYIKVQDNLFTIDLICHGTPSPKYLEQYLKEKKIDLHKVTDVKFRNSTRMGLSINGKEIYPYGIDDYMISFLDSLNYTENCYNCSYASFERVADVTLGDSWGSELVDEEPNGISLILVSSQKGKELLDDISFNFKKVDIDKARGANHQLNNPSKKSRKRQVFLKLYEFTHSFSSSVSIIYCVRVMKRNIKHLIMRLL